MRVYLGIGTNLGDRRANLETAVEAIAGMEGVMLAGRAGIYETAPVGPSQPLFLNTAVAVETQLDLETLLDRCKAAEQRIGRRPTFRWGPRVIDIDLLASEGAPYDSARLHVPHLELKNRRFALEPLCELAPDLVHPREQRTMRELRDALADQGVRRLGDFEQALSGPDRRQ